MPCIDQNTTLPVADLDESSGVNYHVSLEFNAPIVITFSPPTNGSIDYVRVRPSGPTTGADFVSFDTANVDIEYTVSVAFTAPSAEAAAGLPISESPTKVPVFKPVTSCLSRS
jgi:hypothetical protein